MKVKSIRRPIRENGIPPAGDILFDGGSLLQNTPDQWRRLRGMDISMIFQDSGAMLNPTRKIGEGFVEYIRTHEEMSKGEAWKKGVEMLCPAVTIS